MKSTWIKYIGKSARGFAKQKYKYTFSEKITHIDIELNSKRKFHEKEKCEREKWPPLWQLLSCLSFSLEFDNS